ncbi:MAG: UDP-3-O-(3-hydroxymyristoyl)glucosamine N-acyltransferase [Desulfamplus sp.]|nr:UDP-3-O-(3-hydroxymyristoyl)glucosamine N-acyltransferase [Desulfamplus sp.]
MKITLKEIALKIDGEVIGDETLEIYGVSSFYDAQPSDITFASDAKFLKVLDQTRAGAVIVPENFISDDRVSENGVLSEYNVSGSASKSCACKVALIKAKNPKRKFFRILSLFHPPKQPIKIIDKRSVIGKSFINGDDISIGSHVTIENNVTIGNRVQIMHGVYIGDGVTIGDDTIIKPNVTILEHTKIGSRVIIHSGTVIGSDGFGFTQDTVEGNNEKIPHAGFVQIDDDVEIGACNTIDRGTFGRTWIQKGVKIDNLVHIAHNVRIGEHSLIVAQVGIAGSSVIGKRVIIAGKAGVSGHLTVGDGAIVGPGAGVLSDVKPGDIVSGIPGMPHKLWLKVASILPKLPEIRKKIIALERSLALQNLSKNSKI